MSETTITPQAAPRAPKKRHPLLRVEPWVILVVFAVAVWLLVRELQKYNLKEVLEALKKTADKGLWKCVGLTVLSYLVLIGYDMLALRAVGQWLPFRRVALASFTGFAVSYSFGALLGGSTVRYRLYSAWGLSTGKIVRLFVMMGVTFWIGTMLLAGIVFLIWPLPIPDVVKEKVSLPFDTVLPLGGLLLACALGYVGLAGVMRGGITIRGKQFELPSAGITLLQLIVAALDLVVAAGCLYVLIVADTPMTFIEFLSVYLLTVVVVILSHVPGGAGVFEFMMLRLCRMDNPETLVAALLVFRVVYYIIPVLLAGLLLGARELMPSRGTGAAPALEPSGTSDASNRVP